MPIRAALVATTLFVTSLFAVTSAYAYTAQTTTALNVRSGPGTAYRVIDVLRRGERVDVNRCSNGWCQLGLSGRDGWVSARYIVQRNDRRTPNPTTNPDIGFCIDTPDITFGINCAPRNAPLPPINKRGAEVCFYEHINYRGASICAEPGDNQRRLGREWRDRISSIRVFGDAKALVCKRNGYRGQCAEVENSVRRLGPRNNTPSTRSAYFKITSSRPPK